MLASPCLGKGHEFDDLDLVLKRLEHWAHRLYPKLPFDDVMERLAQLGKKQAVKTYVKKVRMDMAGPPQAAREEGQEDHEEDNALRYENEAAEEDGDEDAFTRLMREVDEAARLRREQEEEEMLLEATQEGPPVTDDAKKRIERTMTDEAKERMERNRRMALERRERAAKAAEERATSEQVAADQAEQEQNRVRMMGEEAEKNYGDKVESPFEVMETDETIDTVEKTEKLES